MGGYASHSPTPHELASERTPASQASPSNSSTIAIFIYCRIQTWWKLGPRGLLGNRLGWPLPLAFPIHPSWEIQLQLASLLLLAAPAQQWSEVLGLSSGQTSSSLEMASLRHCRFSNRTVRDPDTENIAGQTPG